MELDRTHVAIRARSFSELADLSLLVLRRYPQAITIGFFLGALPWILANGLLLGWMLGSVEELGFVDQDASQAQIRYLWLTSALVFLQTPVAGVFATTYIGEAIFQRQPPWPRVIRETLRLAPRALWTLGVVRGPLPAMLLLAFTWHRPFSWTVEILALFLLVAWGAALRAFRPFVPEILLLERCPLRKGKTQTLTLGTRSRLLHLPLGGELFGRFFLASLLLTILAGVLFFSLAFCAQYLFMTYRWSLGMLLVVYPLTLWTVAGFATLFRFLSYLDTRIRLEGWEVELLLKAEARRQFGDALPPRAAPPDGRRVA